MLRNRTSSLRRAIKGAIFGLAALAAAGVASAQTAPRSFVASPDIYKVIAQNDQYVVIKSVWKPGQRDKFHSHKVFASYYLTDCSLHIFFPDVDGFSFSHVAGYSDIKGGVISHSVQNVGKSECEIIWFELK